MSVFKNLWKLISDPTSSFRSSSYIENGDHSMVNPTTTLPMINETIDTGGNLFGTGSLFESSSSFGKGSSFGSGSSGSMFD